ncbi:hypothetical protein GE061_010541 [Apolygus lucorum]|uniref:C-type lectin domain-containing protein n=1 Tax=Apolygus lucorum TaxID=248454 RepID=A0A8S9XUW1_APOLU|nr:hypothetical protein GE061_010541 [Apolygus lucorum]
MVLLSTFQNVLPKISPRAKKIIKKDFDDLNWGELFDVFSEDQQTEVAFRTCQGNLKTSTMKNILLKSQINEKNKRLKGLEEHVSSITGCNSQHENIKSLVRKLEANANGGGKCDAKPFLPHVRNIKNNIKVEIRKDMGDITNHFKKTVQRIHEESETKEKDGSYLCWKKNKAKRRIIKIMKENGLRTDGYERLREKQLDEEGGCRKTKRIVVTRSDITFYQAIIECEKKHMRLAVIENERDNEKFVEAMKVADCEYAFAGGIYVEGKWTWITQPMKYKHFASPIATNNDSCIRVITQTGLWVAEPCETPAPYGCQGYGDF